MERLTEKFYHNGFEYMATGFGSNSPYAIDKLGKLEDLEEELGISLITLFKALKDGIYYIDKVGAYDEEHHKWLPTIEKRIVRGIEKNGLSIIDTICSYAECDGCAYYKDYGTRWALTKKELEKEE